MSVQPPQSDTQHYDHRDAAELYDGVTGPPVPQNLMGWDDRGQLERHEKYALLNIDVPMMSPASGLEHHVVT